MGPGTVLGGKHHLLELIGEGAMGAVWSAKNELTERHFALKLLAADRIGGDDARRRLLREARAAGQSPIGTWSKSTTLERPMRGIRSS